MLKKKQLLFFFLQWIATDSDIARSPPGSYEQDWPPTIQKEFAQTDKPPFLPPHLLNIILNKDTAAHVNSTHIYKYLILLFKVWASFITRTQSCYVKTSLCIINSCKFIINRSKIFIFFLQDGVMVLSTTTRYKQKFVTTCFYKPTEKWKINKTDLFLNDVVYTYIFFARS